MSCEAPGSEDSPVKRWELKVWQPSELRRRDARLSPMSGFAVGGGVMSRTVWPAEANAATVVSMERAMAGVGGTTPYWKLVNRIDLKVDITLRHTVRFHHTNA